MKKLAVLAALAAFAAFGGNLVPDEHRAFEKRALAGEQFELKRMK